jgi:hypothetical protein
VIATERPRALDLGAVARVLCREPELGRNLSGGLGRVVGLCAAGERDERADRECDRDGDCDRRDDAPRRDFRDSRSVSGGLTIDVSSVGGRGWFCSVTTAWSGAIPSSIAAGLPEFAKAVCGAASVESTVTSSSDAVVRACSSR